MRIGSSPFYMTNFPANYDSKKLWTVCAQYGVVSDVYVTRKLSKIGKMSALVRFIKVADERSLESKLQNVWIGNYHLYASLARFGRDNVKPINFQVQQNLVRDKGVVNNFFFSSYYANAVKKGTVPELK